VVTPEAASPASSTADFTCALGTSVVHSTPASRPPRITSGARPPSARPSTRAPSARSGAASLSIGRRRRVASPVSTLSPGSAAQMPATRRREVPELPTSTTSSGSPSPTQPQPSTSAIALSGSRRQAAPRAESARAVAATSAPTLTPVRRDLPRARAARIKARCDIDLSPGSTISPRRARGRSRFVIALSTYRLGD
jgi:hypothetical protein